MGMYDFSSSDYSGVGVQASPDTGSGYNLGNAAGPGASAPPSTDSSYSLGNFGDYSNFNQGYVDPTNYGMGGMSGQMDFGNGAAPSSEGAYASTVPGMPTAQGQLGTTQDTDPFARPEPGFWGSNAQKMLSFLANFNPITAGINTVATAMNSPNPTQAVLQGLLGRFGGMPGQVANAGYNMATSDNPGATALGIGGSLLGGQLGGSLGGPAGATFGSQALGSLAGMAGGMPGGPGGPAPQGNGGGRNWLDTAMSVGSGLYGLSQANAQRNLATQAAAPSAAAGAELQKVISGDFTNDAGFKAAQLAAARTASQQPGGFAASAAAQAALKYQNDRISTLAGASGSNRGYYDAMTGMNSANNLAGSSLASMGFGTASGSANPPWLQQYLIQHGMGGG